MADTLILNNGDDLSNNNNKGGRFSKKTDEEIDELLLNTNTKATKYKTAHAVKIFNEWALVHGIDEKLEEMKPATLDKHLRLFYAEVRNKEGINYSKSTLIGIRYGLERHLNQPHINKRWSFNDVIFKKSNSVLKAKVKELKRNEKKKVTHKEVITGDDLKKLMESQVFSLDSPQTLLQNVWFNVLIYFCRRGRGGKRLLTKSSIEFKVDKNNSEYACMSHEELDKNYNWEKNNHMNTGRLYRSNNKYDGYKALKLYLSKLNSNCHALFQYPKKNWTIDNGNGNVWYENRPLGINALGSMMRSISKDARLSQPYTNQCVRTTSVTLLSNAGMTNQHILSIFGNKNEKSLQQNNTQPSEAQLKQCSDFISNALGNSIDSSAKQAESNRPKNVINNLTLLLPATTVSGSLTSSSHSVPPYFNNCTIESVNIYYNS